MTKRHSSPAGGARKKHLRNIHEANPAQVMEQRSVISSDYWGKVKILLREKYGQDLMLLPICSAAGDLCPRDMVRWVVNKSVKNGQLKKTASYGRIKVLP